MSTPTTPAGKADWSAWHHPLYRGTDANGNRVFDAFIGDEPAPEVPNEAGADLIHDGPGGRVTSDAEFQRICDEVQEARWRWFAARHVKEVVRRLRDLGKYLPAYLAAKKEVDAAYAALTVDVTDGKWRAALLRLVTARREAYDAAGRVDDVRNAAHRMSSPGDQVDQFIPPLHQIAEKAGVDLTGVELYSAYSLKFELREEFDKQDELIAEVARLAGDRTEA